MDADRRRILRWLEAKGPALAPVYEGAVRMVLDPEFPGRIRFIAHAVREIWNRLPDEIAPKPGASRTDYSRLTDEIAARWEKEEGLPGTYRPTGLGQFVSINFLKAVAELLEGRQSAFQNKKSKAERLFTTTVDSPLMEYDVEQWTNIHDWAVRLVHVGTKPTRAKDEESLVEHFRTFEEGLIAIMNRYYKTIP